MNEDPKMSPYIVLMHLNEYTELITTPSGIQAWMTENIIHRANRKCVVCKKSMKGKTFFIPIAQRNFANRRDRICKDCMDVLRQAHDEAEAKKADQKHDGENG